MKKVLRRLSTILIGAATLVSCGSFSVLKATVSSIESGLVSDGTNVKGNGLGYFYKTKTPESAVISDYSSFENITEDDLAGYLAGGDGYYSIGYKKFDGLYVTGYWKNGDNKAVLGSVFYDLNVGNINGTVYPVTISKYYATGNDEGTYVYSTASGSGAAVPTIIATGSFNYDTSSYEITDADEVAQEYLESVNTLCTGAYSEIGTLDGDTLSSAGLSYANSSNDTVFYGNLFYNDSTAEDYQFKDASLSKWSDINSASNVKNALTGDATFFATELLQYSGDASNIISTAEGAVSTTSSWASNSHWNTSVGKIKKAIASYLAFDVTYDTKAVYADKSSTGVLKLISEATDSISLSDWKDTLNK